MEFYGVEQVYSESGVDLTLLRSNLERSIDQRLDRNSRAIASVLSFQRACKSTSEEWPMSSDAVLNVEGILKQLTDFHVEFILIGGLALQAHGSAHLTEDADFSYRRTQQNMEALAQALAPLHPYLRGAPKGLPFRFDAATIQAGSNFTLSTDYGALDFLGHISGIGDFEKVLPLSEEKTIYGLTIRVLSIDGLIAAKKAAGRRKDSSHLLELEELKKLRDAENQ